MSVTAQTIAGQLGTIALAASGILVILGLRKTAVRVFGAGLILIAAAVLIPRGSPATEATHADGR